MFSKADKDGSGQVDRAELVEFLKICDEGGFRPFQHHAGLAPDRYRRLMGTAS